MNFTQFLQTWIPLTVGILTILSIVGGALYKVNKTFQTFIKTEIEQIIAELRPNGGSSLKDQVNRLETGHNKIVKDVNELKEEVSEIKSDNSRLEEKLDKMFDTLIDLMSKFTK